MNYLKNEMKISGKDLVIFICDKTNKSKHPYIYKNLISKVDEWSNNMLNGKGRSILDIKYSELKGSLGNIGENKLLLITTIKIIDEFFDIKKKVSVKKEEFESLSEKFKEIRSLAIEYKDEKEKEIQKLNEEIDILKKKIDDSKNSYESMLEKTTQSINKFIESTETEKNIQ